MYNKFSSKKWINFKLGGYMCLEIFVFPVALESFQKPFTPSRSQSKLPEALIASRIHGRFPEATGSVRKPLKALGINLKIINSIQSMEIAL